MSNEHSSDPWHLIEAHQYEDAVAAYDAALEADEDWHAIVANRAIALLCLGRLSESLRGFEFANDRSRQDLTKSPAHLEFMGTVLWLMGHRAVAKELYRAAVDGIRYGTITMGDFSGGVGQGLLLWYAGVATKDQNATDHALAYLLRLSKKRRTQSWPGPLAVFALGRQSFDDVLASYFGADTLEQVVKRAKTDILARRELTQALLALATKRRAQSDEDGCRRALLQCVQLDNPHIEEEWYLAAAEVGLFPPHGVGTDAKH